MVTVYWKLGLKALMVVGPRACGKTTTASRLAESLVRLDRPATAAVFQADPDAALADRPEPVVLDEWQDVVDVLGAVKRAVDSFDRNLLRVRDLQGLPIETLQSIQALDQARREYLRALVDYNAAQFRLQRALGWPVQLTDAPAAESPAN